MLETGRGLGTGERHGHLRHPFQTKHRRQQALLVHDMIIEEGITRFESAGAINGTARDVTVTTPGAAGIPGAVTTAQFSVIN
mgnify:CR=1 FL=1